MPVEFLLPVLLDIPKVNSRDYEGDYESLYRNLINKNVWSLELISRAEQAGDT